MRILIVRIGRAGDIVMTTPAINAIFDSYPTAEITVLTSPDGRRLLNNYHEHLHDIWVWNRSGLNERIQKKQIQKKLKTHTFDIIFCFDTGSRILNLFTDTNSQCYSPQINNEKKHCADHYLDVIKQATGHLSSKYYAFLPVSPAASKAVDEELMSHGISTDDKIVMLHPSYSGYTSNKFKTFLNRNNRSFIHRFWPASYFAELADMINASDSERASPKIIIDLIPEEAPLGHSVLKECHSSILLLTVKPDFERYKALIKRVDLVITPNTGPMHIAAAIGTKTIALFSHWDPEDCGPFMNTSLFRIIQAEKMEYPELGLSAIKPADVLKEYETLIT